MILANDHLVTTVTLRDIKGCRISVGCCCVQKNLLAVYQYQMLCCKVLAPKFILCNCVYANNDETIQENIFFWNLVYYLLYSFTRMHNFGRKLQEFFEEGMTLPRPQCQSKGGGRCLYPPLYRPHLHAEIRDGIRH